MFGITQKQVFGVALSPEVLLVSEGANFSTMALAGTQKVSLDTHPYLGPKRNL